jgi:hypothetical protein
MSSISRRRAALGAIAAVALLAAACGGSSKSSTTSGSGTTTTGIGKKPPREKCGSSGCAVVRTFHSLPPPTVFYGASCSGIHGSWFVNAVEGGGNDALRPSYHLQWSFAGSATSARPSALTIRVPPTKSTTVTMALSNGTMKLKGVRKPNATVTATGTLTVKLSGPASSPSLTFTETRLSGAEHQLGLVSPFNAGGHPLVVPIQHVKSLAGC